MAAGCTDNILWRIFSINQVSYSGNPCLFPDDFSLEMNFVENPKNILSSSYMSLQISEQENEGFDVCHKLISLEGKLAVAWNLFSVPVWHYQSTYNISAVWENFIHKKVSLSASFFIFLFSRISFLLNLIFQRWKFIINENQEKFPSRSLKRDTLQEEKAQAYRCVFVHVQFSDWWTKVLIYFTFSSIEEIAISSENVPFLNEAFKTVEDKFLIE